MSLVAPVRLLVLALLAVIVAAALLAGSIVGPATPRAAAMISVQKGENAVDWARTRKGSPYSYGSDGPHRFDCSGLTRWVYDRLGKSLPHSSAAQAGTVKRINRHHKRRGDLVFFYDGGGVYHVGIFAGHHKMWHAAHTGTHVRKDEIYSHHRHFFGRVR